MADNSDAPRMALDPVADVVHLPVDDQPLVASAGMLLHLFPGKDARAVPTGLR